jgi:hypothetical protein
MAGAGDLNLAWRMHAENPILLCERLAGMTFPLADDADVLSSCLRDVPIFDRPAGCADLHAAM